MVKGFRLTDGRNESRRDNRAESQEWSSAGEFLVFLHPTDELSIEGCDLSIEFNSLRASVLDEQNHTWAQTCSVLLVH